MNHDSVLADALALSKSANGAAPIYKADYYEAVALKIAEQEQRNGEGVASAFARLAQEGDERVSALLRAAYKAETVQDAHVARQRELFDALLTKCARLGRREGESEEAAASRLLATDPVVKDAYEAAWG